MSCAERTKLGGEGGQEEDGDVGCDREKESLERRRGGWEGRGREKGRDMDRDGSGERAEEREVSKEKYPSKTETGVAEAGFHCILHSS